MKPTMAALQKCLELSVQSVRKKYPILLNDNSNVSAFMDTCWKNRMQLWPVAVCEIQGNEEREFMQEDMPVWSMKNYMLPLYVGEKFLIGGF